MLILIMINLLKLEFNVEALSNAIIHNRVE